MSARDTLILVVAAVLGLGRLAIAQPAASEAGLRVASCSASDRATDADRDGLSDVCEIELARAFAPELLVDPGDCALGRQPPARLAGAYLFAVHPVADDVVRIAYLLAYGRDCGWRGVQRVMRLGRSNPHAGDSELIAVDVTRVDPRVWRTVGIFLSAHCLGRSDGRCRWFRDAHLAAFAWVDASYGAPRVWVARDKHANYPTRELCESGHWRQERCARSPLRYRFPIEAPAQNVGSRAHPSFGDGCVRAEELPLRVDGAVAGSVECVWSTDRPFRGWQRTGGASTSYSVLLQRFLGL